jgi:hypothetical protein
MLAKQIATAFFGGTSEVDDCGVCLVDGALNDDWNASCTDCAGVVNGEAFIDNCGDCVGGTTELDACEADCNGVFGGTSEVDDCGVCLVDGPLNDDWNASCTDCAGVVNGEAFIDNCGDCVGGTTELDACEADCNGVFGGTSEVDDCGVCLVDGPLNDDWNASCTDCAGVVNGEAFIDNCGDCVGGTTELDACEVDCNGVFGGTSEVDDCGVCLVDGAANTDWNATCTDCAGEVNGNAAIDPCGDCIPDGSANPIWGLSCLDTTYVVSGSLITESGDPVANATVSVAGMQMITPANGEFMFTVATDAEGSISVEKDVNPLNGITTFDVVRMQQHILGIQSLSSPYSKIAADINANGVIEIGDILQLRRLIIMLDSDFIDPFTGDKNNTSWVFVKPGITDPNPASPEVPAFEIAYNLATLGQTTGNLNFVGVKIGDVNQTASGQGLSSPLAIAHRTTWQWNIQDKQVTANAMVKVDVLSNTGTALDGFQAEIALNGLNLITVTPGTVSGITENHYNVINRNGTDYLLISWSEPAAQQEAGSTLFTLEFESTQEGSLREMLAISADLIRSEAYLNSTVFSNIQLNFVQPELQTNMLDVASYPNPFSSETNIRVLTDQSAAATISVFDVYGSLVYAQKANFIAGMNSITWTPDEQVSDGVYFFKVQTEKETITGRMIFLR